MRLKLAFFWCLFVVLLIFSLAAVCQAQTNPNGSFTNGLTVITISNGIVVSTIPTPAEPVLVSTNGQVIPSALTTAIADQLGLPPALLADIPIKYLFWLFMLVVVMPAVMQWAIKFAPAKWLVNQGGVWISHLAAIKNPTIQKLADEHIDEVISKADDKPVIPPVVSQQTVLTKSTPAQPPAK